MIKLSMRQSLNLREYLLAGATYREAAEAAECSIATAGRVARRLKARKEEELNLMAAIKTALGGSV